MWGCLTRVGARGVLVVLGLVLGHGGPGASAQSMPTYVNVTSSCGAAANHAPAGNFMISFVNTVGFTGGAAVADFNNDGFQDIYFVTSGASPDKLFINNGNGTFTESAASWGITDSHMGIAVSAADYNADGLVDVYITSLGPSSSEPQVGRHKLLRNNGGSFTNVATAAGVNRTTTLIPDGFGTSWGDYDLDGDLDLYVCSWVNNTGGNKLFRNNGNGTFTDVTTASGVRDLTLRGYAPRFADMDGDLYPEIIVTGDFHTSRYFLNRGNGSFANITATNGTSIDDNGMGNAIGDFNGDGLLDWYVTSIYTTHPIAGVPGTGSMLYMNQGDHMFMERSVNAGVNHGGWGWGTVATDFNHDGREDIIATNGWYEPNSAGMTEWLNDPSHAFLNDGTGNFVDRGVQTGIAAHTAQGRALCAIDFDNDGDQDLFIANYNAMCTLLRADLVVDGQTPGDAHWLRVLLDTSRSSRRLAPQGVGSWVLVSTGAQTQRRYLNPGSTYIGQSECSAHFGLGDRAVIDELQVRWTNGRETRVTNVPADQTITVRYCPPDWNGDTLVNSADFFQFLDDLFSQQADYNRSGSTDSQDFYDFVVAFFEGCA
ncbi:MAG: FG-GAP-like repeat-containing protein [Phycisphaerales bacterium]